jgi:transposase
VRKDIAANWRLHHNNAPSHTSLLAHEFLAKHHVATLPQPQYSPDLAPADSFLFKRGRFESIPASCYVKID